MILVILTLADRSNQDHNNLSSCLRKTKVSYRRFYLGESLTKTVTL